MIRDTDVQSMVELPQLDAVSGAALAVELLTRAKAEKKLPPRLADLRDDLAECSDHLQIALSQGLAPAIDAGSQRAADRREKLAWSAASKWLAGRVALHPRNDAVAKKVAAAKQLQSTLFGEGLTWLRLPFKQEWGEADRRLRKVEDDRLSATFALLGGDDFLAELREAHSAFGAELGITAVKPEAPPKPAPEVRAHLDTVRAAIKEYVFQAVAHVDKRHPATKELSDRLLKPYREWQSKPRASEAAPPAPPAQSTGAGQ